MKKVGILGDKLSHSLSPFFQNVGFEYWNIDATYMKWPVSIEEFSARIDLLRNTDYLGANVTVPYKELAYTLVDHIDDVAMKIGAINTIVNKEGILYGFNTDVFGFVKSLKTQTSFNPVGKHVLIIGAGGAARSAIYGLIEEGVTSGVIANRTFARAKSVADEFSASLNLTPVTIYDNKFRVLVKDVDLIVNCSSMGMKNGPAEYETPLFSANIPKNCIVYDMVYNPEKTPLLLEAQKSGAVCLGGLWMLIYQGAESFKLWTQKQAPIELMYSQALSHLM